MNTNLRGPGGSQPLEEKVPRSGRPGRLAVLAFWATVGGAALVLVWNAWGGSLLSSDDAVYAQMAFEAHEAGRWLDQTYLGHVLFEKPPLLFWLLQLTGPAFGWSELGLRLPGILAGIVAVAYVYRLALASSAEATWRSGVVAVALTVATVGFTFNVRRPMTDPLLTAAVLAMIWHGLRAAETGSRWQAAAFGAAAGLGLLAKSVAAGPAALVVGLALLVRKRWLDAALSVTVALLVAAPWHVAMAVRHGATFWETMFGYHVVARVDTALVGGTDATTYTTVFFEQEGAFGALLLLGTLAATFFAARRRDLRLGVVLGVFGLTLVLLLVTSTRLFHYLMPLMPLMALTAVAALGVLLERRAVFALVLVVAVSGLATGPLPHLLEPDYSPRSKALGALVAAEPPGTRLVVWEDYDPALVWYGHRGGRIYTADERFFAIQRSVDMMRRSEAVVWADDDALDALVGDPTAVIVIAPVERAASLERLRGALARTRIARQATVERTQSHVVVRLRPPDPGSR